MVARRRPDVRFAAVAGTDGRAVRGLGVALVLTGALLALASFRLLDWYDVRTRGTDSTSTASFSALKNNADQLTGAGAATAYFDWLSWLLLIGLIVVGVAANVRTGLADPLRVAGVMIGVVGVVATYFAVAQLHDAQVAAGGERHNPFYNSTWGLWLALFGFLVGSAGSVLGPGRSAPDE